MRSEAEDRKPVPPHDGRGHRSSLYMFGRLALSLDKKNAKNTSKQQIHVEKKFCEVSIILHSHGIGAQFQQIV